MEEDKLHEHLWQIVEKLPSDYEPYGERIREGSDCSCGCKWYLKFRGELGWDWGVCINQKSPRVGKLTFEHQGCQFFDQKEEDFLHLTEDDEPEERHPSCNKINIPPDVCYLVFLKEKPHNTQSIGQTNRRETIIADYNVKGEIIGLELLGDKPCQK